MNDQHYIDLVDKYLQHKHKSYPTTSETLAYQRGVLTRFIVDLCKDDFYALAKLQKIVKDLDRK